MRLFTYFSDILGRRVYDTRRRCIGELWDVSMQLNNEVFPRAKSVIVRKRGAFNFFAEIVMDDVTVEEDAIYLNAQTPKVVFQRETVRSEFSISRDILDQQVVDVHDQKVVRVNDVHFLCVDGQLYLAHVDVGLRGLVRRLGWTALVDAFVTLLSSKSPYLTQESFVSWKNAQVLTLGRTKNVLRLDVARQKLARIPPTELAEIMEDLDIFEKVSLFKSFKADLQHKIFTDMAPQEKIELIEQFSDKEAVHLLENIPADEATDLLLNMPKEKTREWMRLMQTKTSKQLRKLLGFEKDSAGGLMTTEYLCVPKEATVGEAMALIKNNTEYPGNIYNIYLVDKKHRLLGMTSLRRFLNCAQEVPLEETCYPKNIFVRTDDGVEEVALLVEKYKFSSIPVLDDADVLQGVITSDDVMEELISLIWKKYKDQL